MWRSDTASWNNDRLDGISFTFKIVADGIDDIFLLKYRFLVIFFILITFRFHVSFTTGLNHIGDSSNILANNPERSCLSYDSKHFRPEITVIIRFYNPSILSVFLIRTPYSCRRNSPYMAHYGRNLILQAAPCHSCISRLLVSSCLFY